MVWDTTTDPLGYLWLAFAVPVILLSGVVLSIVLAGRTKWVVVSYSVLISVLLIGISARAQHGDFRPLTEVHNPEHVDHRIRSMPTTPAMVG